MRITEVSDFSLFYRKGTIVLAEAGTQDEHHDWHNDDSSFALFNQSFDTISEIGGTSFGLETDDVFQSPAKQARHSQIANAKNEHAIEEASTSSEISIGDISPIKLVYDARPLPIPPAMHKNRFSNTMDVLPAMPNEWKKEVARQTHRSNPFFVLRSNRSIFANMKYLLSCIRSSSTCPINVSRKGSIRLYRDKEMIDGDDASTDLIIASRRVDAAICAFGGSVNQSNDRRHHHHHDQTLSIFRTKGASTEHRRVYEKSLPCRYAVNGSHISWEVEENPPILQGNEFNDTRGISGKSAGNGKKEDQGLILTLSSSGSIDGDSHNDPARMKYKCKKCGQIKINHICSYQEKLQRSIGCNVYPAVNSYTAAEPGVIAPAFTEMNNFVSYDSDHNSPAEEYASRGTTTAQSAQAGDVHPNTGQPSTISPESLRGVTFFHSPQSSLSTGSSDSYHICNDARGISVQGSTTLATTGFKRPHEHLLGRISTGIQSQFRNVPFVAAVNLRPEHYRTVTPHSSKADGNDGANPAMTSADYQYPSISLTFPERKRLSDTLFFLSKEIPSITADCAAALREARRNNEWDIAVAELLTQVVVGLFCGEGDIRLDGLHRYLMALGISC